MNICHGVTFVPSVFSFVPWKPIDYYVKLCLQKHQRPRHILQLSPGKCDSNLYFSWVVSRPPILKPGVEKHSVLPYFRCHFLQVWIACSIERTVHCAVASFLYKTNSIIVESQTHRIIESFRFENAKLYLIEISTSFVSHHLAWCNTAWLRLSNFSLRSS